MAAAPRLNFTPLMETLVGTTMDAIPELSATRGAKILINVLDSSALSMVSSVSARNIRYVLLER
jgi:hypothetical protein